MNRQSLYWRAWAVWLAWLSVAGVARLSHVPAGVLHAYPLTSLLWLLALTCLGVTAEAVWNRRPWRLRSAMGVAAAAVVMVGANMLEWAGNGYVGAFLPMVPRLSMWVVMSFLVCLFNVFADVTTPAPVRRPAPRP